MRYALLSMILLFSACVKTEDVTEKPAPPVLTATPEPVVKGGWRKMGTFFTNLSKVTYLFTAQNKAYFMVIASPEPYGTDFFEYDPALNSFTPKARLPLKDWDNTGWGFSIANRGYFGAKNKVWEYNHIVDEWITKADFPKPIVRRPGVFSIGDKGYLCGYDDDEGYRKDDSTYEFDPVKNIWSNILDYAVIGSTTEKTFNVDGKRPFMIVKKTKPDYSLLIQVKEYSRDSNWWIYRTQCPTEAVPLCTWSNNTNGFMLTDDNKSIWTFDAKSYTWSKVGDFPGETRTLIQSFVIGEKTYLGFGNKGHLKTDALNDIWEYNP